MVCVFQPDPEEENSAHYRSFHHFGNVSEGIIVKGGQTKHKTGIAAEREGDGK